jgi:hypothetical protein
MSPSAAPRTPFDRSPQPAGVNPQTHSHSAGASLCADCRLADAILDDLCFDCAINRLGQVLDRKVSGITVNGLTASDVVPAIRAEIGRHNATLITSLRAGRR